MRHLAILCAVCFCVSAAAQDSNPGSGPATRPLTAGEIRQLLKDAPDDRPIEFGETFTSRHAAADGGSGKSTGADLTQKFSSTPPGVALPGGTSANGGGTESDQSAKVAETPWFRILLAVAGIGCLAGAGFKLYQTPPKLAVAAGLGAGGATLLLIAWMPWLLFLLLPACLLIALPHLLPDKARSALDALVDGLAAAPQSVQNLVAPSIKAQATPADLAHIHAVSAQNGNPINLA